MRVRFIVALETAALPPRVKRVCDIEVKASQRLVPSRDRMERFLSATSKRFCNEQSHGLALLLGYIPDSIPDILVLP
jgi:hypothetical protein